MFDDFFSQFELYKSGMKSKEIMIIRYYSKIMALRNKNEAKKKIKKQCARSSAG